MGPLDKRVLAKETRYVQIQAQAGRDAVVRVGGSGHGTQAG